MNLNSYLKKYKQFYFFWKSQSPFSQWYKSKFTEDGNTFNTAEQYMMYHKAKLFGDENIANQILKETNPHKQKKLGRKVKNFDQNIWQQNREKIVYSGNYLKFTQNEFLFNYLSKTKDKLLVEASPYDKIWGIGLNEYDANIMNPEKWKGQNLLGLILTKLREDLNV